MTNGIMNLRAVVEETPNVDALREMIAIVIVKDEAAPWGGCFPDVTATPLSKLLAFGTSALRPIKTVSSLFNRGADRNEASFMNRNRSPASSFGIG